jgi:hypothetical protein
MGFLLNHTKLLWPSVSLSEDFSVVEVAHEVHEELQLQDI